MFRILSKEAALTALRMAEEVHAGTRPLPPEIIAKKAEIEVATRKAYLFICYFRVIDYGLLQRALKLRLELDALYAHWAEDEARTTISVS